MYTIDSHFIHLYNFNIFPDPCKYLYRVQRVERLMNFAPLPHSLSRHLYYFCIFHPFINSTIIILHARYNMRYTFVVRGISANKKKKEERESNNKTPSDISPSIKFIFIL